MSALRTEDGARQSAAKTPYTPTTNIPKSNVQEAIDYAYAALLVLINAGGGGSSGPDYAAQQSARDAKAQAGIALRQAQQAARDAFAAALRANTTASAAASNAQTALTRVNRVNTNALQIVLNAHVFN